MILISYNTMCLPPPTQSGDLLGLPLQQVVHTAEKISSCEIIKINNLHAIRAKRRAGKIAHDFKHPGNHIFVKLPSQRHYGSIASITCQRNDIFSYVIQILIHPSPQQLPPNYCNMFLYFELSMEKLVKFHQTIYCLLSWLLSNCSTTALTTG